jgi:hypothetical protein
LTPTYLAQLRYTQAELNTLEQDSSCEQRAFNAKYKAKEWARRARKQRDEQREYDEEKPRERIERTEEVREARGIGLGGDQDKTRWVPTYPTSHSQPAPRMHETLNKPHQVAMSHSGDSIDHGDSPNHTGRYQLPTPTAHPELKKSAYEGYGIADEHAVVTSSDDYEDNDMYNCRDPPPSGYHPQPPTLMLDVQPPLQPLNFDEYGSMSDHGPYATLFEYHEHEGGM